jgi:hypothetical protein
MLLPASLSCLLKPIRADQDIFCTGWNRGNFRGGKTYVKAHQGH